MLETNFSPLIPIYVSQLPFLCKLVTVIKKIWLTHPRPCLSASCPLWSAHSPRPVAGRPLLAPLSWGDWAHGVNKWAGGTQPGKDRAGSGSQFWRLQDGASRLTALPALGPERGSPALRGRGSSCEIQAPSTDQPTRACTHTLSSCRNVNNAKSSLF